MDEPNEQQEQTVETTEGTPAPEAQASETPPWGDEFDAQRAWDTITNLRNEVKEVKQGSQEREQAQQEATAWQILASSDDVEQRQAAANYLGVELEADQQYGEEGPEPYVTREEWEAQQAQNQEQQQRQQEAEVLQEFDSHLDQLADGAEVKLSDRDRRVLLDASQEYGFSPDATEKAFQEFLDERKQQEKGVIENYVKSKKNAPHVSTVGGQVIEDTLPLNATPQERQRWMTERYQMARDDS